MDSNENENTAKEGDELSFTELDEEECIRLKKKSRRVSFADITSVHVFDRDEDLETPPDNQPNGGNNIVSTPSCESPEPHQEGLQVKDARHRLLLSSTSGLQENKTDSPGSSSDRGTPSEDGEFFGPVSLWHIAPGMSGSSPVADDITLDCTTFSLQFGKLVVPDKQNGNTTEGVNIPPLDTEGRTFLTEDFKTPAGQPQRASIGNAMVLTEIKKPCARWIDSEDETFDSHEGMNNMSLIEEKHFSFDFASLPPDLDSLLAEKLLQVQENSGTSCHELESATSSRKTCHDMELKASAITEMRMSTTESTSTIEQDNVKMKLDQERNQIMIENMGETQQQQHKHVGPLELERSTLEFMPSKVRDDGKVISATDIVEHNTRSKLTTENIMKGQNKNKVEHVIPYPSQDVGLKDPSEVGVETVNFEIMSTNNNATGFTPVLETSQSKVEIMATNGDKDNKLRQSYDLYVSTFEGQQQEQKQNRLLEVGCNMESGDDACNNYERSACDIVATKHDITSEAPEDVEVNTPMDELEAKECSKDNTSESAEGFAHSNFDRNECNQKRQRNEYGVSLVKGNSAIHEILANKCYERSTLKMTDDSLLSKSHEKQQTHHNQQINEYDPTEDVGRNIISNNIVANNCEENNKLKPVDAFSLSNFDGKQQHHQIQRKLLPLSGTDVPRNQAYDEFATDVQRNQSYDWSDIHDAPSNCISQFDCMEECQQQQKQFCSFSEGFNSHGNSTLLENQLVSNLKESVCIPETVKMKVTTPGKEQKQEISSSAGHVSSIGMQISSANGHTFSSTKLLPESNEVAERNGKFYGKFISQVLPVPTKGSEKDPKYLDASQHEVSSGVSESKTKHSIPSSKSSSNSIEQLKEPTELDNAHIYLCDENKEDFNLKDISLTSLLSASEIPLISREQKKRSGILNNSLTTPKQSSGNRVNVNMMPCSQYVESKSSVPRNDQGISSSHKENLSQDQMMHSDRHFNDSTGLASHLSTPLISSQKKTESACEAYDRKGASLFGNTGHVLISKPEEKILSSLKPTSASISDNVHDMTPLGSFEECVGFNAFKSNYSCVNKNEAKYSDAANAVFSTPVNFISHEDAISNNSQVKRTEHLNLCRERCQLDLQSSFPKHVRDSYSATPASVLHKQTTNFVDNRVLIKGSSNSSLCGILHLEGNINVVERGQTQEECILQCPHSNSTPSNAHIGCVIPQNLKYSASKESGPVKLNTEYSSALTIDNEEACTPAAQSIKIVNNDENVSLPLAEKEWSSILKKQKVLQRFEEASSLKKASGSIPCGSIVPVNSKDYSCLETTQFPYASVKMFPTEALNRKAFHGRKWKGQEMENKEEDSLIKHHTNSSIIKPAEGGLTGKVHLQNSEGRMFPNKKPFAIRTQPTEDIMVAVSRKMISIDDKFSQGVEKLHVPLIAKPKTLEECLRFVFLSQPQLHLLQVTINQIREDINRMKVSSSQQFQALDGKEYLQIEKKPILTMNQRLGLVKWLQHVVVYEKSKLQLLQEKKHELMKKGQELQSGCHEVDKLKSQFSGPLKNAMTRAEKEAYIQSLEAEIAKKLEGVSNKKVLMEGKLHSTEGDNQKSCEGTIIMKQELEGLGNKIKDLCDYYCGVLKVKSNADKDEITMLLKHHIEKRSLTTLVLKDMQLWKVKEIKSNPGDHFIELSYNDVLCQRFVFEGNGSDLNVSTYNRMNNETIGKVFPFMNACEAFQYVIGLNQIQKIGGPSSIWQAVRETSCILGTLMDVLEEVQVCRMRLPNLSFTQFVRPADQELQLQLTFIDCSLGLKARVVLDMSNLRCAVYPCDVLPLKVDIEQFRRTSLMPEELDEVMVGINPGYSRIKDLCGRISNLIESKR